MIRRAALCLTSALLAPALPAKAQVVVATGDAALGLGHLLHGHPEGMLLTLPSASGQSLGEGAAQLLAQERLLPLNLPTQELSLSLRSGQELQSLRGWSADQPHWALLSADRRLLAEGTELPTAEKFLELYRQSGLRSRADLLRDFLRRHPDQSEALAQLILELRGASEQLMARRLGLGPDKGPEPKPEGKGEAKPEKAERSGKPEAPPAEPVLLDDDADAALWEEYAGLFDRLLSEGHWLDAGDERGPLPIAMVLVDGAEHSPRLRALAERLIPLVESALRRRPNDARRWQVWVSLRQACGKGRPGGVMAGLLPPPGTFPWPPTAAVDAFVEDARHTGDWRTVEPLLEAAFDQTLALLDRMDDAALEDAGRGSQSQVRMGTYFGFGGWTGELSLLVEAKLRLHKLQEADQLVQATYARVSRSKTLDQAAALARECGEEGLAQKWEALKR